MYYVKLVLNKKDLSLCIDTLVESFWIPSGYILVADVTILAVSEDSRFCIDRTLEYPLCCTSNDELSD